MKGWQQKLTQLEVAHFPWDPKPEVAPPAPAAPPPSHSQAKFLPQIPQPVVGYSQNGIKQEPDLGPKIKSEPGTQPNLPPGMAFNGMDNKNNIAASRAAQLVQQQYGQRAAGSVSAIQGHVGQQPLTTSQPPQHQQQQQQQPQYAQHPQQPQYPQQAQQVQFQQQQVQQGQGVPMNQGQQAYRQQIAAQMQQQQRPPANGQNNLQNSQTDGAGDADSDFEAVLMRRSAAGELEELGRADIDSLLHQQIAAKAKSMEGGGLMLPLKEATKHKNLPNPNREGKGIAAHDGGDEDEVDEDAINSDLDDPEDGNDDDEVDDEGLGHIMLCMYDKVQRVKNKW